jgi:hypothetical protein
MEHTDAGPKSFRLTAIGNMIFLTVPVWLYVVFRRQLKLNSEWAILFTDGFASSLS